MTPFGDCWSRPGAPVQNGYRTSDYALARSWVFISSSFLCRKMPLAGRASRENGCSHLILVQVEVVPPKETVEGREKSNCELTLQGGLLYLLKPLVCIRYVIAALAARSAALW